MAHLKNLSTDHLGKLKIDYGLINCVRLSKLIDQLDMVKIDYGSLKTN